MKPSSPDFRSRLKRVKGMGSAHHGVSHWWMQRVTAVAMIPLTWWFISALLTGLLTPNVIKVAEWFASPVNAVMMILLLSSVFYHMKLGMQVVIEDYVKCPCSKFTLLFANTFISFIFAAVSILAVLKLHFLDIAATM